jgi:hypothetical protein
MNEKYVDLMKQIVGHDRINNLSIQVPTGLYYYAESLENGNEDQLEGKVITFDIVSVDVRDNRTIEITIKECPQSDMELNYQTARKLVLEAIKEGCAHSVNITTNV